MVSTNQRQPCNALGHIFHWKPCDELGNFVAIGEEKRQKRVKSGENRRSKIGRAAERRQLAICTENQSLDVLRSRRDFDIPIMEGENY